MKPHLKEFYVNMNVISVFV